MIVIEGGDNVGKTTLRQQLIDESTKHPLFVLHRQRFSPTGNTSIQTIGQSYLEMLMPDSQDGRDINLGIADRLLASEWVYGELFRGGCRLTAREHFLIRAALASLNALVIFCDPPDATILASWEQREQLYARDPLRIAERYRMQIADIFAPLRVFRYDWTATAAAEDRRALLDEHAIRVRRVPHAGHNSIIHVPRLHSMVVPSQPRGFSL